VVEALMTIQWNKALQEHYRFGTAKAMSNSSAPLR
jgi:hypothetical protein